MAFLINIEKCDSIVGGPLSSSFVTALKKLSSRKECEKVIYKPALSGELE